MRSATLLVLFSAVCVALEPAKPADTDGSGLQGEWLASRVEVLQEEAKDSKKVRVSVEGDKLVMSGVEGRQESYSFKLDNSKTPRVIDLYQGSKLVSRSIYTLEKDGLRLCLGLAHWRVDLTGGNRELISAGDRPTAFDSRQGVLFVLQRSKGK